MHAPFGGFDGLSADETAPGVRYLKRVWSINEDKERGRRAPKNVNSDIYNIPETNKSVPRRHRSYR